MCARWNPVLRLHPTRRMRRQSFQNSTGWWVIIPVEVDRPWTSFPSKDNIETLARRASRRADIFPPSTFQRGSIAVGIRHLVITPDCRQEGAGLTFWKFFVMEDRNHGRQPPKSLLRRVLSIVQASALNLPFLIIRLATILRRHIDIRFQANKICLSPFLFQLDLCKRLRPSCYHSWLVSHGWAI